LGGSNHGKIGVFAGLKEEGRAESAYHKKKGPFGPVDSVKSKEGV